MSQSRFVCTFYARTNNTWTSYVLFFCKKYLISLAFKLALVLLCSIVVNTYKKVFNSTFYIKAFKEIVLNYGLLWVGYFVIFSYIYFVKPEIVNNGKIENRFEKWKQHRI